MEIQKTFTTFTKICIMKQVFTSVFIIALGVAAAKFSNNTAQNLSECNNAGADPVVNTSSYTNTGVFSRLGNIIEAGRQTFTGLTQRQVDQVQEDVQEHQKSFLLHILRK